MSRAVALLIVVIAAFAYVVSLAAHSQARDSVSMEVSPTTIAPTIAAGDSTAETVTIRNSSDAAITVSAEVDNGALERDGIRVEVTPGELSIGACDTGQVTIGLEIAQDAKEGHHQSTILFLASPHDQQDVSIAGQVAVLLDVDIIHPVSDVRFDITRLIDANDPAQFTIEARNTSRFPTKLKGTVDLSGPFTNDLVLLAESGQLAVGESASLQVEWRDTPTLAVKKAKLSMSSGVGSPVEKEVLLLVFPWRLSLFTLAILLIAAGGAISYRFFR